MGYRSGSSRRAGHVALAIIIGTYLALVAGAGHGEAVPKLPPAGDTNNPPAVSGVPEEGRTLTTTTGGWT